MINEDALFLPLASLVTGLECFTRRKEMLLEGRTLKKVDVLFSQTWSVQLGLRQQKWLYLKAILTNS